MKAALLLFPILLCGQTITNWQVDGVTHSTARVGFSKIGDTTTDIFVIVSTTLPTDCVTDTNHRRYNGNFSQVSAENVVIPVTGLAPSTTFKWGVCRISDNTLLSTSDDATPDANIVTSAEPSVHPVKPINPTRTVAHKTIPTTFTDGDFTETSCANFQSQINTQLARASITVGIRIILANSAAPCAGFTANTARGAGSTGIVLITNEDHAKLPPWGVQVMEMDANKTATISGTIDVDSTNVWVRGFHVTGPATGSTVNLITSSGTDVVFQHMYIDRALGSSNTTRSAFDLTGATRVSMLDNYIRITMGTSQARCLQLEGAGSTNIWFRNNYMNCPGNSLYAENNLSSDANWNSGLIAEHNIIDWDEKYLPGSATSDGVSYGAWQAMEFKGMQGALITSNWIRRIWPRQDEFNSLLLIAPRVATCGLGATIRAVNNVEFSFNWSTAGGGLWIGGFTNDPCADKNAMPYPANNFWVHNNLFSRLRPRYKPSDSSNNNRLQSFIFGGIEDILWENNTIGALDDTDTRQVSLRADCGPIEGFIGRNNILRWANANAAGGLGYTGSCTWALGGSPPANTGPAKDFMDLYYFRLGSGASYSFINNGIAAQNPTTNGYTNATISAANWFPSGQTFLGDGTTLAQAGYIGTDPTSEDLRKFCLPYNSANLYRGHTNRQLGHDCIQLQEKIGNVYNVSVLAVTSTTAKIAFVAPGGSIRPGAACDADVSTNAAFTPATTSRITSTVNTQAPWNQITDFNSLTPSTNYHFRLLCAGLPYTGTFSTTS